MYVDGYAGVCVFRPVRREHHLIIQGATSLPLLQETT